MTGIRSCIVAISSLGLVVTIVHERSWLPSGEFHVSHNPPNANGLPERMRMYIGVFRLPSGDYFLS
jgi:hypothetical protein